MNKFPFVGTMKWTVKFHFPEQQPALYSYPGERRLQKLSILSFIKELRLNRLPQFLSCCLKIQFAKNNRKVFSGAYVIDHTVLQQRARDWGKGAGRGWTHRIAWVVTIHLDKSSGLKWQCSHQGYINPAVHARAHTHPHTSTPGNMENSVQGSSELQLGNMSLNPLKWTLSSVRLCLCQCPPLDAC